MTPEANRDQERSPEAGEAPERVAVGRINAPWGVRGHVKVTPLTNNPERLAEGERVYVAGEPREIRDVRRPRGYPVIRFEGIDTPEAADRLRGALLEIDEADLPPLPEDEYYVHDLVGLAVVTTRGEQVGTLEDVLETGSNDVYVVKRPGRKDALIPAIQGVLIEVDLDAGVVTIEAVPGLLD